MNFAGTCGTGLRLAFGTSVAASSFLLAGCLADPTYGTGKAASAQLVDDLGGAFSLRTKRQQIDYEPRPDLVKPAPGAEKSLPAPQQNVATAGNPEWPESPEQKRARLRAEITANQDNPNYDSPIEGDVAKTYSGEVSSAKVKSHDANLPENDGGGASAKQRDEFNRRLAEQRQGSPDSRKYLSEPPLTYREAAATAPANDVGEDELKKERRRKAEAQKKKDWSWRNLFPSM